MTEPLNVADLAVAQMRALARFKAAVRDYDDSGRPDWSSAEAVELRAARRALAAAQRAYDDACDEAAAQLNTAAAADQGELFG